MALNFSTLKNTIFKSLTCTTIRLAHQIAALPPPLDGSIQRTAVPPPPCVLPENDRTVEDFNRDLDLGFGFSGLPFGGGMEVMAVPKRKTTPHKRGIRNGPKALKPIPVIIRCKSCGRIKLPHFFCCSGHRGNPSEKSDTAN